MLQFQQGESTAERRRWIIVLVDASDGVTGLTGQTGTVKISKNGGSAVDSTNSLVEVDAGDMPGHYYVELTAGELDTLGGISITAKTAGSLAFHDRATVSYNDPYVSQGGFSGGSSAARLTKRELDYIAERVWKYRVADETTAQEALIAASNHPASDHSDVLKAITSIPKAPALDLSPVLDRLDALHIPEARDYTAALANLAKLIVSSKNASLASLQKTVKDFTAAMAKANREVDASSKAASRLAADFAALKGLVDEFNSKVAAATDMDKRFESMTSVMQKQSLDALAAKIDKSLRDILVAVTNNKYDILKQLK